MGTFHEDYEEERKHLDNTLAHISRELDKELGLLGGKKAELVNLRKEMWENAAHFSTDFEKLTEISQYLSSLGGQSASYTSTLKQIGKYRRALQSPYFGRFDFVEEGSKECEKVYVGIHSVIDGESGDIIVYDWRAPISSIFYEYGLGDAEYETPLGRMPGKVLHKRQYKIEKGRLLYFFDSSLKIDDEMLQQALCRSSSPKMRNIVETIQKEQNVIIRDTESDLLIVQGAAGSGKTSIALHRIVYLLYQGLNNGLNFGNILIVSPNEIFGSYISGVIPELGEEEVRQMTFGELCGSLLGSRGKIQTRSEQLEYIISGGEQESMGKIRRAEFKGSSAFAELLDRLMRHFEHKVIAFEDVYYDGKLIESKQVLRNLFLNGKISGTTVQRLKRLKKIIFDRIHPLQRKRAEKMVKLVRELEGHDFDYKTFGRLLSIRESARLKGRVRRFTEVDYMEIYRLLFSDKKLFFGLARGMELPQDIEEILETTRRNLEKGYIEYEDCAPLLYIKLSLEGSEAFNEIRHTVIDEAQDYSPLQYMVFKLLFGKSRFTVLGDICQAIGGKGEMAIYDQIAGILEKNKPVRLVLNKSYRSTREISDFSRGILGNAPNIIPFERHGEAPLVCCLKSREEMEKAIMDRIAECLSEGLETVAVVCKTAAASSELYERIKNRTDIGLAADESGRMKKGAVIIPSYLAKGLEFDAVIVHDASDTNYCTGIDGSLLYIACSRALHRLILYYTGSRSRFITQ